MKKKHLYFAVALFAVAAAASGCKKKPAADKVGEGSGSALAAGGAGGAGGAAAPDNAPPAGSAAAAPATDAKPLLATAKAAGSFNTFAKAIDAAGLADKLSGAGPFTVFAPTDEAFAKLPPKDLDALLADKAKLEALLEYHVVPGTVTAKDLAGQKTLKSIQGGELPIDTSAGVKVGAATVTKADIAASNGVIHAIDTVLTPPA